MAGEHWSDIARRREAAARTPSAPQRIAAAPRATLAGAAAQNPALARLMEERERLEARMHGALTGGTGGDPRDALRFKVAPIAQRRAEYAAWSDRREALSATPRAPGEPDPPLRDRVVAERAPTPRSPTEQLRLRATPGETPGGTPERAGDWFRQRLDRARPAAGKVAEVARGARSLGSKLGDLDRQFADADRQLAAQGASEDDRKELARIKKDLGLDKLDKVAKASGKADAVLKRATALPDGYNAAQRKLEDGWAKRRDAIAGEDHQSYMKPLRALNQRVLGMGLPDIEERAAALKGMAQDRRRAARDEAQADDARRERALEKRKAARDGV